MSRSRLRVVAASAAVVVIATVLTGCAASEPAPAPEPAAEPAATEAAQPASPSPEDSPAPLATAPELVGVTLERTGGIAAVPGGERWQVGDPAELERLRALLPEPVPESFDRTSPCADCYLYELVVSTKLVGVTLIYRFDDASFPEELRPLVDALIAG